MLTLIVFIPLAAALALLFVNRDNTAAARNISVLASSLSLFFSSSFKSVTKL